MTSRQSGYPIEAMGNAALLTGSNGDIVHPLMMGNAADCQHNSVVSKLPATAYQNCIFPFPNINSNVLSVEKIKCQHSGTQPKCQPQGGCHCGHRRWYGRRGRRGRQGRRGHLERHGPRQHLQPGCRRPPRSLWRIQSRHPTFQIKGKQKRFKIPLIG